MHVCEVRCERLEQRRADMRSRCPFRPGIGQRVTLQLRARAAVTGHWRGEQAVQSRCGGPRGDVGQGEGGPVSGPEAGEQGHAAGPQQPYDISRGVRFCCPDGRVHVGKAVPDG